MDELGTALVPPEAGDRLIQDEQGAVLVAQAAQAVEVAGSRRLDRLGLQDHRGDLARLGVEPGAPGPAGRYKPNWTVEPPGGLPECPPTSGWSR